VYIKIITTSKNKDLIGNEKFDGENFALWKQHIQVIFKFRDSWVKIMSGACKHINVIDKYAWYKMYNQTTINILQIVDNDHDK
jgi:hypothetical protein